MNTLRQLLQAEPFKSLPELDIGDRVGFTGYIDFIKPKDMEHPMMKGRDVHGRLFLAINVDCYSEKEELLGSGVGTFFERYSDSETAIAFGTNIWSVDYNEFSHSNVLYHDSRVRGDDFKNVVDRLTMLLDGKTVYNYSDNLLESQYAIGNGELRVRLATSLSTSLSKLSI